MRGFIIATAILTAFTASAQNRVCVEEVAGVCLKYALVAPVSPAQRAEQALSLRPEDRREVQRGLTADGFYDGSIDGALGPQSRRAIRAWQTAKGQKATGFLTRAQVDALAVAARPPAQPQTAMAPAPQQPAAPAKPTDPRDGLWTGALKCNRLNGDTRTWSFLRPEGRFVSFRVTNGTATWTLAASGANSEKWKITLDADGDARLSGNYTSSRQGYQAVNMWGDWKGAELSLSGQRGPRNCRLKLTRK